MFGNSDHCDRCGDEIDKTLNWGVCECCGEDLCENCAGSFNDDGECEKCATVYITRG